MEGENEASTRALAAGVTDLDAERVAAEVDSVDRIVATLYKLAYRPR